MAFTSWAFSTSQTTGEPSVITVTSVTSGVDATITQRRVYISDFTGAFLVPDGVTTEYNEWDINDASVDIDCLEKDMAVRITVQWLNVSNAVVYDSTQDAIGFKLYNETFDYGLTRNMAANYVLSNDSNFMGNKTKLRNYIDSGDNAIEEAADLYNAQLCYNKATELRLSRKSFFNENN